MSAEEAVLFARWSGHALRQRLKGDLVTEPLELPDEASRVGVGSLAQQ